MIGKIERVALREVWKDEARDFTQWLQENLDVLNEVLDVNPENAGGYRDEEKWPGIYDQMVNAMVKLEKSIKPSPGV